MFWCVTSYWARYCDVLRKTVRASEDSVSIYLIYVSNLECFRWKNCLKWSKPLFEDFSINSFPNTGIYNENLVIWADLKLKILNVHTSSINFHRTVYTSSPFTVGKTSICELCIFNCGYYRTKISIVTYVYSWVLQFIACLIWVIDRNRNRTVFWLP